MVANIVLLAMIKKQIVLNKKYLSKYAGSNQKSLNVNK
jgi:hypothetical protein